jgi:membrane protease YdiL (CAAX protease family)
MVLAGSVAGWRLPPKDIATNGLMLAVATFASTPVLVGLSWLFAWSRRALPVGDYLGLRGMAGRQVAFWVVGLLALLVALDGASVLLQRPVVPQFMLDAYSTAGFAPLLWGAVVVAAPLGEEVFFRGFLFAGLAHSRVRWLGAILISSTGWSLTHVQYDLYGMSHIFFVGLFLGFARWQARSVWLCVLLHALMNLLATIQVACYLG